MTARDLDAKARNELKTLTKDNADGVARHLVMAARLIDDDPALAHEHAQAASRRAGRIGIVRETVALTAYRLGDYALALRELRTYRRITGRDDQIAVLVDSERGLGRPDRALEEGRAVDRSALTPDVRAELAIAMSGARLDQDEPERALAELDIPELDPDRAFAWSPALFAARAVVLEELGRDDEAAEWRRRAEVAEEVLEARDPQPDVVEVDDLAPDEPTVSPLPASTDGSDDPDVNEDRDADVETADADAPDDADEAAEGEFRGDLDTAVAEDATTAASVDTTADDQADGVDGPVDSAR